ncbi:hypothetical protein QVD17_04121 [Tagetes erecta]|uniref:Uncharacterized protein n=1 Tax=Tagetes erecta TaxID=13708 RepID=A0AAD8L9L0_TARER|nr:hypothetical protein QVD17_04121 [Tagetes erecta]
MDVLLVSLFSFSLDLKGKLIFDSAFSYPLQLFFGMIYLYTCDFRHASCLSKEKKKVVMKFANLSFQGQDPGIDQA